MHKNITQFISLYKVITFCKKKRIFGFTTYHKCESKNPHFGEILKPKFLVRTEWLPKTQLKSSAAILQLLYSGMLLPMVHLIPEKKEAFRNVLRVRKERGIRIFPPFFSSFTFFRNILMAIIIRFY